MAGVGANLAAGSVGLRGRSEHTSPNFQQFLFAWTRACAFLRLDQNEGLDELLCRCARPLLESATRGSEREVDLHIKQLLTESRPLGSDGAERLSIGAALIRAYEIGYTGIGLTPERLSEIFGHAVEGATEAALSTRLFESGERRRRPFLNGISWAKAGACVNYSDN